MPRLIINALTSFDRHACGPPQSTGLLIGLWYALVFRYRQAASEARFIHSRGSSAGKRPGSFIYDPAFCNAGLTITAWQIRYTALHRRVWTTTASTACADAIEIHINIAHEFKRVRAP